MTKALLHKALIKNSISKILRNNETVYNYKYYFYKNPLI